MHRKILEKLIAMVRIRSVARRKNDEKLIVALRLSGTGEYYMIQTLDI